MARRVPSAKQSSDAAQKAELARSLLSPVIRFLAMSGVDENTAKEILESEWRKSRGNKPRLKIAPFLQTQHLGEVVSAWTTKPDYLDASGSPRVLAVVGRRSFASLVAAVNPTLDHKEVAAQLRKYGNVRSVPPRKIRLLKGFLHVGTETDFAFEPSVRFLADASSTINSIMNGVGKKKSDRPQFWRTAERRNLPAAQIDSFLAFLQSRSLMHLKEVDDWLQARTSTSTRKSSGVRAGVGIFTICTKNDYK